MDLSDIRFSAWRQPSTGHSMVSGHKSAPYFGARTDLPYEVLAYQKEIATLALRFGATPEHTSVFYA